MKSVIISVCLLLAVSIGVTLNAVHTCSTVSDLRTKAEHLNIYESVSKEEREIFESLRLEWNKKRDILTYLYDYREIENIELAVVRMESAIYSNELDEFPIYKSEFLYSLSRLEEISIFSFKNIL